MSSARVKYPFRRSTATVLPGMSADVTFILAEVQKPSPIPTRALVQTSDSENTVFVITDNRAVAAGKPVLLTLPVEILKDHHACGGYRRQRTAI